MNQIHVVEVMNRMLEVVREIDIEVQFAFLGTEKENSISKASVIHN